jgi:MYXO-CTERM domain-containing protein
MNEVGSSAITPERATALMREAFAIWENARCGEDGGKPAISISEAFGPAVCDVAQYNTRAGNANLVIFRDDGWPYAEADHELAATWLTVDKSGTIVDADIEINSTLPLYYPTGDPELELGVIANQRDLLSIMVHEAGHFLGLDHSRDDSSVMQAALSVGEQRSALGPDDEAAICAAYPPAAAAAESCDYTPRGGFASECTYPSESGCGVQRNGDDSGLALMVAGLGYLAARQRRRR